MKGGLGVLSIGTAPPRAQRTEGMRYIIKTKQNKQTKKIKTKFSKKSKKPSRPCSGESSHPLRTEVRL